MYRGTRHSVRDDRMMDIGKGEIIKKLQNQSHNLSLDLESLKLCQKNLPFDQDIPESGKFKLNSLLDNMINRIQDELEEIVRMINTLHHTREISEDLLKEVDLFNLRYSKLALQTEKVFVSTPLFMELRSKGATSGFGESYKEGRNVSERKVDRSMREYNGDSPLHHHHHDRVNKSFTTVDNDHRPYMKDTFNSKIKKEISHKRIDSVDQNRIPKSLRKSPPKYRGAFNDVDPEWIDDLLRQFSNEEDVNKHQKLTLNQKSAVASQKSTMRESPSAKKDIPKSSQTLRKTSFDFPPSTDVVKRELQSLRNFYNELKERLDSHTHTDYETLLEKLKYENAKVLADNKVIQKDNSEVMHTLFNMKKEIQELKDENQKLKREVNKLKSGHTQTPTVPSVQIQQTNQSLPTEENRTQTSKTLKKERPSEQSDRQSSSRFLISQKKKENQEEDELVASWVKRRLGDH